MSEHSPGGDISCKLIAAFIALSSHLVMHQIDVTSAHFSVAFSIPLNNISIYFSKLFSFRCLLITVGTVSEFLISEIVKHFDFGALNGEGKKDNKYRKFISMACFALVLAIRVLSLIFLYRSSDLGYYVYIILSVEAFFFGFFQASVIAIVPEHSLAVALAANASRLFILLTQFCLDTFFYGSPLLMIKLQVSIVFVMTGVSVVLWFYYHQIGPCSSYVHSGSTDITPFETGSNLVKEGKNFGRTFADAISPFMMFFVGSMFKDFLYPGVLPYALLKRDMCHRINMIVPVSNMIGPVVLFFLEIAEVFPFWEPTYNWFWVFGIPMAVTFVFSFMPIHTRIPFFRSIINSRIRVMYMTLGVVFCNGFLDTLSFGGVAKVVKPQSRGRNRIELSLQYGDNRLITFHAILALFMRFVFSKISVGYNDTRVSLGYCLPKFRPLHRMSKSNTFWYIIRQTFKTAWKDTGSDFSMNIKNYL